MLSFNRKADLMMDPPDDGPTGLHILLFLVTLAEHRVVFRLLQKSLLCMH